MIKTISATILFSASALAQPQVVQADKVRTEMREKVFVISSDGFSESPVSGAPFSADETDTTTQMLFDGNRIVNTSTAKVYRDQQGRTRVERTLSNIGPLAVGQPSVSITINDPVANVRYTLDPEGRIAYKTSSASRPGPPEAIAGLKMKLDAEMLATTRARTDGAPYTVTYSSTIQRSERAAKREELGASNMAGVAVKGSRSTMVIPAGAMGNDRDINIVDERWYSPELKMNIMTKHTDPRMGETVFQVNNLSRSNPDPSLFQVPADYQVKDGPKAMQFTFKTDTKE